MTLTELAALASAGGAGSVLTAVVAHLRERSGKRREVVEAKTAAEVTDRTALTKELWDRLRELETLNRETRNALETARAQNVRLEGRVESLQAEVAELRAQCSAQETEIQTLNEVIRRLTNATGPHRAQS